MATKPSEPDLHRLVPPGHQFILPVWAIALLSMLASASLACGMLNGGEITPKPSNRCAIAHLEPLSTPIDPRGQ